MFGQGDSESEEDSEDLTEYERYARYWGWYITMDSLSNNSRKDWDYFFIMPIKELLNTLSFYKNKQQIERAQLEKLNGIKA